MQTSIRIVVLDYYMSTPIPGLDVTYSEFRGTIVNQVPILRCFGSTENGKKICVHIHGVFPYLYIPYDGRGKPEELMHQISVTLDKAINVSFNQASSNAQHIYKISLVSGIPMYGYHSKKHQFFKIYLYNPNLISKVGSFFINRKVLEQMFQPHEIHLNFTLQFMIDYNLHGMSNMLISEIRYRMNLDSRSSDVDEHLFLPPNIEKNSLCELEADINAESILNRQEILSGNLAINPGIATLWDEEKQRRRNKNENSQLGHFLELKNMLTAPTKTHIIFQQALKERLAVLSTDKDIVKQNPDGSIYPAETPHDSNIQNASLIDIHSSSSLELSLDDTLNMPHSQSHDETITSSGENLNLTMDQDAQDVLRLLAELAAETVTENENEDESILSQVVPDDQNDESAEDFLDLSMPLASLTTPTKIVTKPNDDKSDDEETDYFNTTLIPQMDGQIEYTDSDDEELTQQSPQKIRQACGKSMPLLDVSNVTTDSCTSFASPLNKFNLTPYVKLYRMKLELTVRIEPLNTSKILTKLANNRPNTRARNRQTTNNKLDETLRLMRHRINRIDRKSRIKKIGQRTRKYEINTLKLLKQTLRPKCNIVPGRKWFLADKGPITSSNDEKSTFSQGAYSAKCVGKRRHTIPSMYINCDGAVDSSSEDERKTNTKRKAVRRKLPSSQYTPLGITVTKSPKVQGNYQGGLADNTVQITGDHEVCQESASKINPSKLDIPHKRKLIFENETTSFNHTTSEEFISCMYSPKPFASAKSYQDTKDIATRKLVHTTTADQISATNSFHNNNKTFQDPRDAIHLSHVSKQSRDTSKNDQNKTTSQVHIDTADPHKKSVDSNAVEPNNSQNYDSTSSDSDLFSDNDGLNRSFFKSYNLTISEKYDNEYMYKAKEGCSTKFSPNSMPNSISSLKSQQHKVLSDNSSSDIPPYQNMSQYNSILNNESIGTTDKTDAKKNCNLTEATKQTNNNDRSYRVNIIKPSFKAPSRLQVERSLTEYKIPHVQQQEPYYSNVDDYTGVVEIGHRIMRIASKTSAHLSEFDSEFNGLNNHRKHFVENVANLTWNSNNVKNLRLTHCSNKTVTVHPVKKPPSVKQVREWVKAHSKSYKEDIASSPEAKTERTKIHIPTSPGNDADLDLSLSLTPYTDSESFVSDPNDDEAHKSLPSSQLSTSPVLSRRKKRCELNCKPPSLRDSVLLSEETNKSCQITGISQENTFGFNKSVQNLQAARALTEHQCLTTMVMELHIRTRGDLKADPQFDCICAIFYSVFNDVPESSQKKSRTRGVIAVNSLPVDLGAPRPDFLDGIEFVCDITYVQTEEALINSFLSLIKYWDPDIFAGYEIQMLSWGYLVDRAFVLSINIVPMLGRSELHKYGKTKLKSLTTEIESNIIGRIVLDVWRIMRHEIALQSYTFESIVYHILHRRVPMYPFKDITFWWDHRSNLYRHRVLRYYLQRVDTVLELFDKLDFLNRTSELARLFGILFYEVLSRGSQFRVESMMLRLAKPLNYIPVSPDVNQRAQMKAPEYIALVMEPESKLYTDPVIVLDFQSLYPSIIIAYNYCFTTCVGRVRHLGTNHPFPFGATQLKVSKKVAEKLCKRELLNYSPCGVAFVRQKVREGILPRMLKEVLDTRLMVKNSMKENKGNDNLQKVLHNRQLGLKLIANVTYGYTAANFSGRMCCVEVGDSVVSKGRETLQRAIALVESTPEWEAKVVYGDTDSMFVLVPGKTKEEAFEVGKKIADAVTADNPDPIKLKLEKVYQPCILQTKKRYVGYMYETPDQKEPVYEAKGIETVRRDGCPAVAKILQKCLTLLFETKNVSLIKSYVLRQFHKIQTGRASIQDLTFAKEYRGASGYKPGACVPALELARKWKVVDRRNEPRSGERVPYIIVNGPPGLPLIRLVKSPRDLLNDTSLRPNALYYITKVIIPPVNRCLNLIGADLNIWFNQMPRKNTQYLPNSSPNIKSTISQYFISRICASCSEPTQDGLCADCCRKPNITALRLTEKLKKWEENYNNTVLICQSCTGCLVDVVCASLDCPVLYRRTQTFNDLQQSTYVRELLTRASIFLEESYFG